jgi:hypothetical protein
MSNNPENVVALNEEERASIVNRKAACPFIGSAVAEGLLTVRNDANDPLASIEDVRRLGNTGGGDLGDVLVLFASGNHKFMRGGNGKLSSPAPDGLFSLEFPGSQGSHPGHSRILQEDPAALDSGRLSEPDFERLTGRAKDGWIKRSDVGRFIAENLDRDKNSKVLSLHTAELLIGDFFDLLGTVSSSLLGSIFHHGEGGHATHRDVKQKFTKLTGEDNLAGSAGEFGLLFAFLAHRPGAKEMEDSLGEPAVMVDDLKAMFVEKRLPDGWETWKKTRADWVHNTLALSKSARAEYKILKRD